MAYAWHIPTNSIYLTYTWYMTSTKYWGSSCYPIYMVHGAQLHDSPLGVIMLPHIHGPWCTVHDSWMSSISFFISLYVVSNPALHHEKLPHLPLHQCTTWAVSAALASKPGQPPSLSLSRNSLFPHPSLLAKTHLDQGGSATTFCHCGLTSLRASTSQGESGPTVSLLRQLRLRLQGA